MTAEPCHFCGLPVSAVRGGIAERNPQSVYCCFGCEFAAEVTRAAGNEGQHRALLLRIGLAAFCTMNVLAFTMVLWAHDVYPSTVDARAVVLDGVLRYLGLLFSLPVWFVLGQPLLTSALGNLRRGIASTDFLVCLGVLAAYGFSIVSTWRGSGAVYYEVACVILVLITLGRWFEAQGKLHAGAALDELERLVPDTVCVHRNGSGVLVPIAEVQAGDCLRIQAGECISVDGIISEGCAHLDERLLTGESWPVEKRRGDAVRAGAFALDGHLDVIATSTTEDGSLGRLVRGLRDARRSGGKYERLAERVTNCFLPAIIGIALVTVGWHGWHTGWEHGIMTGLSVLLIACPCALGLATPLAAWTAFSHAARHQVLFRSGEALERLAGIRAIAWDKTGTLTSSEPVISQMVWGTDVGQQEFLSGLVGLAQKSKHPFSRAVVNSLGRHGRAASVVSDVREQPGRGIVGQLATGDILSLGNHRLATELHLTWSPRLLAAWKQIEAAGQPAIIGGCGGVVRCLLIIQESLRPGAADVVYQLQSMGIQQQMLTGDLPQRAAQVVQELFATRIYNGHDLPEAISHPKAAAEFDARAELTPDQKVESVKGLRRKYGSVAMVGDGVNDAPALTAADVGVSLRSGTDISRDSSAVCLFGDDIRRLPWALEYARFTVRIIQQNLFWAFAYNAVGVSVAAAGYLNPSVAAVLMVGSSLFVIANTWRLSRETPTTAEASRESRINLDHPAGVETPDLTVHEATSAPVIERRGRATPAHKHTSSV